MLASSFNVAEYARRFAPGHWSFLGPGSEKKWCGTHTYKSNGERESVPEIMMINFCESGHPVFRGSSALERGDLKSKGKGNMSVHFNGSDETFDVVFRTMISVNQLSIYGAVADMCEELAWEFSRCSEGTGTRGTERFRDRGHANRIVDNQSNFSDR